MFIYGNVNRVDHAKRHWINDCGGSYYTVDPTSWVGGIVVGNDVGAYDGMYDTYSQYGTAFNSGSSYDKNSNHAKNYSVGVTLPWGLSLSAQSGYSTWVKEHWNFSKTSYLYGTSSHINIAPVLYAQ